MSPVAQTPSQKLLGQFKAETTATRRMDILPNRAILTLAGVAENPLQAVEEYVDNGGDASASLIYVVIEPGSVTIVDNGSGMLLNMMPDDAAMLQEFKDSMRPDAPMRLKREDLDFKSLLSYKESTQSLQWLMENITLSGKALFAEEGKQQRGRRAIGALAYRKCNDGTAIWLTRPNRSLAKVALVESGKHDVPTYFVQPPNNEDLELGDMTYISGVAATSLADPFGQPLEHGTSISILNLKPEVQSVLNPDNLVQHLHKTHGADIRQNKYRLMVVDRVTKEGKKTPGGRILEVPPAEYSGIPLIEEVKFTPKGKAQYGVDLRFNPEKKGSGFTPYLRVLGKDTVPMTVLPEFQQWPWDSGYLHGYVEFPVMPETDAPLSPRKEFPIEGPIRNQWQKSVNALADRIEKAISEIEERRTQEQAVSFAEAASARLNELFQSDPEFRELMQVNEPDKTKGPREPRGKRKTTPPTTVVASVWDEHRHGVPDIQIELRKNGTLIARDYTGRGGSVSFGRREYGQYELRLVLPDNIRPASADGDRHLFQLTKPPYEGISYIFKVVTGREAPSNQPIRKIGLRYTTWNQVSEPWRTDWLKAASILEINTEAPGMKEVFSIDLQQQAVLSAGYIASAIVTELQTDDQTDLLLTQSRWFAKILPQMLQAVKAVPQQRKAGPRKKR